MPNIQKIIDIAHQAGSAIMAVYQQDFSVYEKQDSSPLTEADLASHRCIEQALREYTPDIPLLSEESAEGDIQQRQSWDRYWLIDPLDGTKEFIKKNGEFTVNIALIENHEPVMGVVYAPAIDTTYYGTLQGGAYCIRNGQKKRISICPPPQDSQGWRVVGSRSHQSDDFVQFMQQLPQAELLPMGSSLKLCLVAEGKADLYPRLGPTSEWDTAAAHAVVKAAGGQVLEYPSLQPLRYNTKESLLNPWFIVCSWPSPCWAGAAEEHSQYEYREHTSAATVVWNHSTVTPQIRAVQKDQYARCFWLTGLSGSGKSTLANALEQELVRRGYHCMLLDGDNVRHGLCKDLGMSDADRTENIRRVAEVARLMTEAGLIVITAFISPFRSDRDSARALFKEGDFIEVFVDTPLDVCEQRDPKGLYKKARSGEIKEFTGISSPYEVPLQAEMVLNTADSTPTELIEMLIHQCLK